MAGTINRDTQAYANMTAVAKMLEAVSRNGYRYEVEDCYLDFGQDWMWTTIICHNDDETGILGSWQAINPRQWDMIVVADSISDLARVAESIKADDRLDR